MLHTFGSNSCGQLGNDTNEDASRPTPIETPLNFSDILPNRIGWETPRSFAGGANHTLLVAHSGALFASGDNNQGQLGLLSSPKDPSAASHNKTLAKFVRVPVVGSHRDGGEVPVEMQNVACGWEHSLALDVNGRVWVFGDGQFGQLGLGTGVKSSSTPRLLLRVESKVTKIACGIRHNLVLSEDGQVWGWGSNKFGELGPVDKTVNLTVVIDDKQSNTSRSKATKKGRKVPEPAIVWEPVALNLPPCIDIACGQNHSAVITKDGEVLTFGRNRHGQLGISPPDVLAHTAQPQRVILPLSSSLSTQGSNKHVSGSEPVQICCGWGHTGVRLGNGQVFMWGRNDRGQLAMSSDDIKQQILFKYGSEYEASSTSSEPPTHKVHKKSKIAMTWRPIESPSLRNVRFMAFGSEHGLAIDASGKGLAWGWNEHGNCGTGDTQDVLSPQIILGTEDGGVALVGLPRPSWRQVLAVHLAESKYTSSWTLFDTILSILFCLVFIWNTKYVMRDGFPLTAGLGEMLVACILLIEYIPKYILTEYSPPLTNIFTSPMLWLTIVTTIPPMHAVRYSYVERAPLIYLVPLRFLRAHMAILRCFSPSDSLGVNGAPALNMNTVIRYKIIRLISSVLLVLLTGSTLIFLVEATYPVQSITFFDAFFFTALTMGTVGYRSDLVPDAVFPRSVILLIMFSGFVLIPYAISELVTLVRATSSFERPFKHQRGFPHVLLLPGGTLEPPSVKLFLNEFFSRLHGPTAVLNMRVVILHPEEPTPQLRRILRDPLFAGRVHFVKGSPVSITSLKNVQAHKAEACFILANNFTGYSHRQDADNILRAMALNQFDRRLRLYMEVLVPDYRPHFEPFAQQILCIDELRLAILGHSCTTPGFATLLFLLTASHPRDQIHSQLALFENKPEYPYMKEYLDGCSRDIFAVKLSPFFAGSEFWEVCEILYGHSGVTLFALGISEEQAKRYEEKRVATARRRTGATGEGDIPSPASPIDVGLEPVEADIDDTMTWDDEEADEYAAEEAGKGSGWLWWGTSREDAKGGSSGGGAAGSKPKVDPRIVGRSPWYGPGGDQYEEAPTFIHKDVGNGNPGFRRKAGMSKDFENEAPSPTTTTSTVLANQPPVVTAVSDATIVTWGRDLKLLLNPTDYVIEGDEVGFVIAASVEDANKVADFGVTKEDDEVVLNEQSPLTRDIDTNLEHGASPFARNLLDQEELLGRRIRSQTVSDPRTSRKRPHYGAILVSEPVSTDLSTTPGAPLSESAPTVVHVRWKDREETFVGGGEKVKMKEKEKQKEGETPQARDQAGSSSTKVDELSFAKTSQGEEELVFPESPVSPLLRQSALSSSLSRAMSEVPQTRDPDRNDQEKPGGSAGTRSSSTTLSEPYPSPTRSLQHEGTPTISPSHESHPPMSRNTISTPLASHHKQPHHHWSSPPPDISNHVVLCSHAEESFPRNLEFFMASIRSRQTQSAHHGHAAEKRETSSGRDFVVPVIIICLAEPRRKQWKLLRRFEKVYYVQGNPMLQQDLLRARIRYAKKAVILADVSQPLRGRERLDDARTLLVYLNIRGLISSRTAPRENNKTGRIGNNQRPHVHPSSAILVFAEFVHADNMKFLLEYDTTGWDERVACRCLGFVEIVVSVLVVLFTTSSGAVQ
ncbi:hypothetical protein HK102_012003 [Quaeritorhiza haematococci]|nr:hypothetical protein HK102_012003 [Quaeritorhiza haematococci]